MHPLLATCLLLTVSLASIVPGFPILMLLQNYFPEPPAYYTIDHLAAYAIQASGVLLAGVLSMCVYSDVACPLAIKGYALIFSNM